MTLIASTIRGDEKPVQIPKDLTKRIVERPTERLISGQPAPPAVPIPPNGSPVPPSAVPAVPPGFNPVRVDVRKYDIEGPVKQLVAAPAPPAAPVPPNGLPPGGIRKEVIEFPVKKVVTNASEPLVTPAPKPKPAEAKSDNPKVEPGLVKWHPDLATACEAAKKSGKPVLLFQMMGKLDDQFC
jgi:hypothetical protein